MNIKKTYFLIYVDNYILVKNYWLYIYSILLSTYIKKTFVSISNISLKYTSFCGRAVLRLNCGPCKLFIIQLTCDKNVLIKKQQHTCIVNKNSLIGSFCVQGFYLILNILSVFLLFNTRKTNKKIHPKKPGTWKRYLNNFISKYF